MVETIEQWIELGPRDFGTRLDKVLVNRLAELGVAITRSRLEKAFAADEVVDEANAVMRAAWRVDCAKRVVVRIHGAAALKHAFPEDLPLSVLFEDEHVLFVNKPPRMAVHGGPGHEDGTLVNAVLHHLQCRPDDLPTLDGNGPERPGVVHRLDRDTSGVMVFAKTLVAQEGLATQFRAHSLRREYIAIVRGAPKFSYQRLETQHGRDPNDRRRYCATVNEGRKAISEIYCEEIYEEAARLRFRLHTGRTHQIRMHCRHLGFPVIADELYSGRPRTPLAHEMTQAIGRQALHAKVMEIDHPITGERPLFDVPYPEDFQRLLDLIAPAAQVEKL